ncbi:MAG: hypothetical protein ACHQ50_14135 [Fimbriimonadales bacterium]
MIAIVALLASAQSGVARIEIPAQPVSLAIRALAASLRQDLRTDKSLDGLTLLISANAATPQEVEAKLARACSASWLPMGTASLFTRTRDQRIEVERAERTRFAKAIEAGMREAGVYDPAQTSFKAENIGKMVDSAEALLKEATQSHEIRTPSSLFMPIYDKLPAKPYSKRIAAAIGPQALSQLEPGDRIVYTSKPNQLQAQLPKSDTILPQYVNDLTAVQATVEPKPRGVYSLNGSSGRMDIPVLQLFSSRERPEKVVFTASRSFSGSFSGDGIGIQLESIGQSGRTLDTGNLRVPADPDPVLPRDLVDSTSEVSLSPEEVSLLAALAKTTAPTGPSPGGMPVGLETEPQPYAPSGGGVPPEPANPAVDLVKSGAEPLAGLPSDLLRGVARANHLKLLAVLPDSCFGVFKKIKASPKMPTSDVLKAFAATRSVDMAVEDGWLIVTPIYSMTAAREHVDRDSMRRLLLEVEKRGDRLPMDGQGQFYLANPNLSDRDVLACTMAELWGGRDGVIAGLGAHWLRFYSAILGHRPGYGQTATIPFSSLDPAESATLRRAAFSERLRSYLNRDRYLTTEPTEVFVDGIPDGKIVWRNSDRCTFRFVAEGEQPLEMDIFTLARLKRGDSPEALPGIPAAWRRRILYGDFQSVQPNLSKTDIIEVKFSPSTLHYMQTGQRRQSGLPVNSLERLPQDLLDELKRYSG